jgi:hypothetical protein
MGAITKIATISLPMANTVALDTIKIRVTVGQIKAKIRKSLRTEEKNTK